MNKSPEYVMVTKKILKYIPNWEEIIGKVGKIISEQETTYTIHIGFSRKKHLNIIYTVPKDCCKKISYDEAVFEALIFLL